MTLQRMKKIPAPLIAFFLAIIVFLLFLWIYGVLGYGNFTILRGDLYVQYIDFIAMFLRVLKGQEDFWYTFSLYYGSGTILSYAYYAFSPFNLLYLIDVVSIPAMTAVIITLKIALAAFTFTFFAQKCLKCSPANAIFFSLCYALGSFSMTMHFNMIWLDAVYMLPVVVLLLFRLVRTGHFLALTPAWAYLFLTNFYMSYILGVFSVLVLIALLVFHCQGFSKKDRQFIVSRFLRFSWAVLLAAGISAAILLPTAMFLVSHMAADNSDFQPLGVSILDICNSLFIGEMPELDNRAPFLYCGLPVLLLLPFYFGHKKITRKEKYIVAALLLFYAMSMLFLPLFIVMHAFDYPNWYFFRFSFCLSFLLCGMAGRTLQCADSSFSMRKMYVYAALLLVFYSFMIGYGRIFARASDVTNSPAEYAINILFITLWLIMLTLHFRPVSGKLLQKLLPVASFAVLMVELALNAKLSMDHIGLTPQSEAEFNSWYAAEKNVLSRIPGEDAGPYRICVYGENNSNAPALMGYAGFNTFSSSDDYELRSALYALGISGVNRCITELGYTDVTRMLFGAKYIASIIRPDESAEDRVCELETFPYSLPFAYMVSNDLDNYTPSENPFENQEKLVSAMTGSEYHFFDPIELRDLQLARFNADVEITDTYTVFSRSSQLVSGAHVSFTAPRIEGAPFMACFYQKNPMADYSAPYTIGNKERHEQASTLSFGCIYSGGNPNNAYSPDTETVVIYFPPDALNEYPCHAMFFARYNNTMLPKAHEQLSAHAMQITNWSTSCLHGSVTATEACPILFTSIPYDEGWHAYVDGLEQPVDSCLNGAFAALRLTPGEHEITLQYIAPGSEHGLWITLGSVLLYLLTIAKTQRTKKEQKQ